MTRILVVDNHDSFVFSLVQYLLELGAECVVKNRSQVDLGAAEDVDGVLLSPGPGHPSDAGICLDLVHHADRRDLPLLGVCLGHQVIAVAYGGSVGRAAQIVHGYTSPVHHTGSGVLAGLPVPFAATRYHSLAVDPASVPAVLEVTAWAATEGRSETAGGEGGSESGSESGSGSGSESGSGSGFRFGTDVIMGLRHRYRPIQGIQFHPESVLSEGGHRLLRNWLDSVAAGRPRTAARSSSQMS